MMLRHVSTSLFLSALLHSALGFVSQTSRHAFLQKQPSLNAVALNFQSEEDASYIMQMARECAFSDTCSVEEAGIYLNDVFHVQSGCAGSALLGHEVCENQDVAAEIVANLRAKIEKGAKLRAKIEKGVTEVK
jgi:hypothetical protein